VDNLILFGVPFLWAEVNHHVRWENLHHCLSEFSDFLIPNFEKNVFSRIRDQWIVVKLIKVPLGFDFFNYTFLIAVNLNLMFGL